MIDEEKERTLFEQEVSCSPFEYSVTRCPAETATWPGNYRDIAVDLAWNMWKIRAEIAGNPYYSPTS